MKRVISFILVIALLVCAGTALAATTAGTASDPLISLSYINNTYIADVVSQIKTLIGTEETQVKTYLTNAMGEIEEETGASGNYLEGFKNFTAVSGDQFTLPFGSSFILLEGAATVQHTGAVINVAKGEEMKSGSAVGTNQRCLVAEDTSAVFTVTSATAKLMINGAHIGDGTAVVSFVDVPSSHFAYNAIIYLAGRSLVSGMGGGQFQPGGQMTRGMFVTLLGRIYGVNTGSYTGTSFTDVSASKYYAPYVEWAAKNSLVSGNGDGTFAPDSPITRQQMATLVVSFADYAGYALGSGSAAVTFADDASIASWAKTSVYRAQRAGLVSGRGGNIFAPQDTATRAEVCAMVYRLITG